MIVTVPIQVEIPDGYEFVRYGIPYDGELYTYDGYVFERPDVGNWSTPTGPAAIIRVAKDNDILGK